MILHSRSIVYVDFDLCRASYHRYKDEVRSCRQCGTSSLRRFVSQRSGGNHTHYYCVDCATKLNLTSQDEIDIVVKKRKLTLMERIGAIRIEE